MVDDSTYKLDVGDKLSGFKSQVVLFYFVCFVFLLGVLKSLSHPLGLTLFICIMIP